MEAAEDGKWRRGEIGRRDRRMAELAENIRVFVSKSRNSIDKRAIEEYQRGRHWMLE